MKDCKCRMCNEKLSFEDSICDSCTVELLLKLQNERDKQIIL
jgi:hypothetical protein